MSKISKNIKRLRIEKGLTQDLLAEKINISRQAVSSWENDRTQPDVEMLGRLAEVFEVSLEELIYGKKRNTTLELEKQNYNSTITIVFSILGTLLVGAGLVLIFVTFWQDMPLFSKGILSFVPLLLGQASGLFVLFKKKDKVPWCEGGSVLWTAGIAATLTLIYNIFDLSISWTGVLLMVTLSVMPVIGLLRSVAPLAVYYGCGIYWGVASFTDEDSILSLVIAAVMVILGVLHSSRLIKIENKSHRSIFAQWISVVAMMIFITIIGFGIDDLALGLIGLMAASLCLYLFSFKESDMAMPYRMPGLFMSAFMMFIISWIWLDGVEINGFTIGYTVLCLVAILVTGYMMLNKSKDKFAVGYAVMVFVALVMQIIGLFIMGEKFDSDMAKVVVTVLKVPALVAYILLMISGAREKKLIPINFGFLGVAGLVFVIISQSELSMLGNGLLLLAFGAVFLAINFKISKAKQKVPAVENNEEVQNDEK